MTVTIDIPDELVATLSADLVRQYANNFAIAGLRQVTSDSTADIQQYEAACAAIAESRREYERGQHMTLAEAKARFAREQQADLPV